jgi:hypothetical protein
VQRIAVWLGKPNQKAAIIKPNTQKRKTHPNKQSNPYVGIDRSRVTAEGYVVVKMQTVTVYQ